MSQMLEKAIGELRKLSEAEQDAIAALIFDELDDERRWEQSFKTSQTTLERLAAKARDDIRIGRIREGGFNDAEYDKLVS